MDTDVLCTSAPFLGELHYALYLHIVYGAAEAPVKAESAQLFGTRRPPRVLDMGDEESDSSEPLDCPAPVSAIRV